MLISANAINPQSDLIAFAEREHTGSAPARVAPSFEANRPSSLQEQKAAPPASQTSLYRKTLSGKQLHVKQFKTLPPRPGSVFLCSLLCVCVLTADLP